MHLIPLVIVLVLGLTGMACMGVALGLEWGELRDSALAMFGYRPYAARGYDQWPTAATNMPEAARAVVADVPEDTGGLVELYSQRGHR